MTSSDSKSNSNSNSDSEYVRPPAPAWLGDFLAFTLAGERPRNGEEQGTCHGRAGAHGIRYSWLGVGLLQLESAAPSAIAASSVLVSAGVHGDETAPIELLSQLVADVASGALPLACRLLVVLGNIQAMRDGKRYVDYDLNRLFGGKHAQWPESHEAPRAAELEITAARFFDAIDRAADVTTGAHARWHIDMHTAIRASVFEQFALLPHTGAAPSRAMFDWLARARIVAVLLHTAKGNTYTHFTAETCGALACTLELGKVRPFGENDLSRFAAADRAVRALVSGASTSERSETPMPRVFTVVDQITKLSAAFELRVAADVPNFTSFPKGTLLALDGEYRYVVGHDEERIVFPNPTVKPGLRAGLMVIDTTRETLAALAA
jgi:succinylglutamate desuccinylase